MTEDPSKVLRQIEAKTEQLRELIREANGVVKDLVRERKATERLAREMAATVIEAHVNGKMDELEVFIGKQMKASQTAITESFGQMLAHYMGDSAEARKMGRGRPSLSDVLAAHGTLNAAMSAEAGESGESGGA